jgi:hypothetical protein
MNSLRVDMVEVYRIVRGLEITYIFSMLKRNGKLGELAPRESNLEPFGIKR